MKQLTTTFLLVCTMLLSMPAKAMAGSDKGIAFGQLPDAARRMVNTHFNNRKVAMVKMETELFSRSYEVLLTNGDKLEFDRHGDWTSIDCSATEVPVKLMPATLLNFIRESYDSERIRKIERDRKGYEVKLSNGLDIIFNKNMQFVGIDD